MFTTVALCLVGLVGLVLGSDLAVGAARDVARRMRISEWVVGLTVTAVGTSLPELATTARAALAQGTMGADAAGLAFGNILGSNIFVITGLLGLSALVAPLPVDRVAVRRDGGVLMASVLALGGLMLIGPLSRWAGGAMVLAYVAWLVSLVRGARDAPVEAEPEPESGEGAARRPPETPETPSPWAWLPGPRWVHEAGRLLGGLAVVVGGADLLVRNGVELATAVGVPGTVVGVLVGIGTSLPELVVSIRAAQAGAAAVSLGNIIGSSVSNLLLCLGLGAVAAPLTPTPGVLRVDLPFVLATTAVALLLMREREDVSRREGGVLLILFLLYMAVRLTVGLG